MMWTITNTVVSINYHEKMYNLAAMCVIVLDIAVGAYLSGHVVLLRTRPTVAIEHSIYSPHQYLHYNSTEFQLAVCFMYRGQYVGSSIRM